MIWGWSEIFQFFLHLITDCMESGGCWGKFLYYYFPLLSVEGMSEVPSVYSLGIPSPAGKSANLANSHIFPSNTFLRVDQEGGGEPNHISQTILAYTYILVYWYNGFTTTYFTFKWHPIVSSAWFWLFISYFSYLFPEIEFWWKSRFSEFPHKNFSKTSDRFMLAIERLLLRGSGFPSI